MVLCAGLCWSFIPLGVRGFQDADVWQILFYRSIGLLPMVLWLVHSQSGGQVKQSIRRCGLPGLIGALGLVAAYAGGIKSVQLTSIANAAFLFATAPFLSALLGRLILGEAIRKFTLVALALALVGIVVMVSDSFSTGNWLGDALAFLSAIGFAVFTIALRATKDGDSLPVVLLGGVLALLLALLVSVVSGHGLKIPLREILLALALGAFLLGVGMVLCTLGSRVVPAGELALLCMTEIIFAPVWAWLFLEELPSTGVLAGGMILILAIVLNAVTGMRYKQLPAAF